MTTEPFSVRAGILDTSAPDRAQAIAEAGHDLACSIRRQGECDCVARIPASEADAPVTLAEARLISWPDWLAHQLRGWMLSEMQSTRIKSEVTAFLAQLTPAERALLRKELR